MNNLFKNKLLKTEKEFRCVCTYEFVRPFVQNQVHFGKRKTKICNIEPCLVIKVAKNKKKIDQ